MSDFETRSWHSNAQVKFKPNALYDEAIFLAWANERVAPISADARRQGRESCIFAVNLHGQTTTGFLSAAWRRGESRVYLLPGSLN